MSRLRAADCPVASIPTHTRLPQLPKIKFVHTVRGA